MTGCVVCLQDEGWCEFCPDPDAAIETEVFLSRLLGESSMLPAVSNRDPGDENDFLPPPQPQAVITHRSYKATYRLGHTFRTSTMIGFDSFQDTAYLAIRNRREGEKLVGLTELT